MIEQTVDRSRFAASDSMTAMPATARDPDDPHGAEADPMAGLRLLQLASPALPIGGYSYSTGLESTIDSGIVHDAASAAIWIGDMIELVQGRFDAPVAAAAHRAVLQEDAAALAGLHRLAWAARETAELRLESEQMGYSLDQWVRAILDGEADARRRTEASAFAAPVVWGIAGARLGLTAGQTVTALLWGFVENQVMVLLKAMPMGQIQGQRLLHALVPVIERAAAVASMLPRAQWSSSAPGLALASMQHEVQYSRLFRS